MLQLLSFYYFYNYYYCYYIRQYSIVVQAQALESGKIESDS